MQYKFSHAFICCCQYGQFPHKYEWTPLNCVLQTPLQQKLCWNESQWLGGKKKQIFVASSSEGGCSSYNSLTTWRQNAFQRPVCLCFLQWGGWITEHVSISCFAQSGLWAWWLVGTELTLWPGKARSRTAAGGQNSSSSILPPVQYVHKLLPSEEFSGLA